MRSRTRTRDISMFVAGVMLTGLLVSPAGAHVTTSLTHLWAKHVKPKVTKLVYTKAQSDARYLGKTSKARNSGELDGMDSTQFAQTAEGWHLVGEAGEVGFNVGDAQLNMDYNDVGPSPHAPGTICSWANFDGVHSPASFYRDADGMVHLSGLVKASNGSLANCGGIAGQDGLDHTIFRLPPGYRPSDQVVLNTMAFKVPMRIDVHSTGMVSIGTEFAFTATSFELARNWVTLDSLSFAAAAPAG